MSEDVGEFLPLLLEFFADGVGGEKYSGLTSISTFTGMDDPWKGDSVAEAESPSECRLMLDLRTPNRSAAVLSEEDDPVPPVTLFISCSLMECFRKGEGERFRAPPFPPLFPPLPPPP